MNSNKFNSIRINELDEYRTKTVGLFFYNILLVYLLFYTSPIVWDYELKSLEHENKLVKMLSEFISNPYITVISQPKFMFILLFYNMFMLAPVIKPCQTFRFFLLPTIIMNCIFWIIYLGNSLGSAYDIYQITMNILPAVRFYLNSAFIASVHMWFILSTVSYYDLLTNIGY